MTGIFYARIVRWIGPPVVTPITSASTGRPGHTITTTEMDLRA
jgi:hypothetical protein